MASWDSEWGIGQFQPTADPRKYGKKAPPPKQSSGGYEAGITPTQYSPWGPANQSWSTPGTTGGAAGGTGRPAAPKGPGLLSTPGEQEQLWPDIKQRWSQPLKSSQYYSGLMGRTGGAGLQPARTSEAFQAAQGYFNSPTMTENWAGNAVGQLGSKGYTEQLYESGNQGLNTYYDRERDKRQKRLEDTMSAAGVFGSGATAKGMFELEAELGAQQARDMADLARDADAAKIQRFGEGRLTADAGTTAMRNRYGDYFDAGQGLDSETRQSEMFNRDTARFTDNTEMDRDERLFGMGGEVQDRFQDRVRLPLKDKQALADRLSPLFSSMRNMDQAEQREIAENIIQSLVAEGQMDYAQAAQMVEDLLNGAGIAIRGLGNKSGSTSSGPAYGNEDPYGGIGR